MKHDYYLAGRWRNFKNIQPILHKIRKSGKTVYCFIENEYDSDGVKNLRDPENIDQIMTDNENLKDWQTNPTFKKIFDNDTRAIRESKGFIAVFPIGFSVHTELGYAYGLGKKCYAIGQPEKTESLYFIFDQIFPSIDDFLEAVK